MLMTRIRISFDPLHAIARALGIAAVLAIVCAAAVSARSLTAQTLVAIAVLGILAALATALDVDVQVTVGLSGNAMILTAAMVVFRSGHQYLGIVTVAILGALDLLQLRRREYYKIAINAGVDSVALLVGSFVFWSVVTQPRSSQLKLLIGAALGAGVYYGVHCALLSAPVAVTRRERYWPIFQELLSFDLRAYPFAILGVGLGWV